MLLKVKTMNKTGRMDSSYILNIAVYSVVFLGYAICRVIKAVSVKNGDLVKAV